jgi:hypothetical protein
MTKLEGMTKDPLGFLVIRDLCLFRHSTFVLRHFVLAECVWIPGLRTVGKCTNIDHKTIVSPRAGPTLTMDNFAPVNSEMYLTYFLAAEGSCENFRAE